MTVLLLYQPPTHGAQFKAVGDFGIPALFEFDATLSESHALSVEYTEHPTEDGFKISDAGIVGQDQVSFTGSISRTSLNPAPWLANLPGRLERATEVLYYITQSRLPVTVSTPFRVLVDYYITSIKVSRSPETGQAADYSIELKKINTVSSASVAIPLALLAPPVAPGGSAAVNAGTQTAAQTNADAQALKKPKSGIAGGVDFLTKVGP